MATENRDGKCERGTDHCEAEYDYQCETGTSNGTGEWERAMGMGNDLNAQFYKYIQISNGRNSSSSENLNVYPIHRYRTSLFRHSFFNRIVKLWNSLPLQTRKSPTLYSFKTNLYKHDYFSKLHNIFDKGRLNMRKTTCPYCRSVSRPLLL